MRTAEVHCNSILSLPSKGASRFQLDIDRDLGIIKHPEGRTGGMCKATYVYNSPGGLGKVHLVALQILNLQNMVISLP